jgi:hypothetical protein
MVVKIQASCMQHAHGLSEGLTFVNPDNPSVFMQIGHNRQWAWASAILELHAGVDETHPPRTPEFEWEPVTHIPTQGGSGADNAITVSNSPIATPI